MIAVSTQTPKVIGLDHRISSAPLEIDSARRRFQLSDWVKRGIVRPERILAVTFTEAAAGELRERIRAGLLADGLVAEAMAVERAYVSTIHGLGLRLLTEHALSAGASAAAPSGRCRAGSADPSGTGTCQGVGPDQGRARAVRLRPNFVKGETVEDSLRARVLSMIDLLRGLGDKGRDAGLIAPALTRLDAVYGPVLDDPIAATTALRTAVQGVMIAAFPEGGMAGITAKTNVEAGEKPRAFQTC